MEKKFIVFEQILQKAQQLGFSALIFLIIVIFGYFVALIVRNLTRNYLIDRIPQKEVATFVSDILFYTFIILIFTTGLGALGININAIIAGLGLGGFALGFALRDIIGNFVSGLLLIVGRTIEVGDEISIQGSEGRVLSINLRHTVLLKESDNGKLEYILIPNSIIFSSITIIKKKVGK